MIVSYYFSVDYSGMGLDNHRKKREKTKQNEIIWNIYENSPSNTNRRTATNVCSFAFLPGNIEFKLPIIFLQ